MSEFHYILWSNWSQIARLKNILRIAAKKKQFNFVHLIFGLRFDVMQNRNQGGRIYNKLINPFYQV